MKLVRTLRIGKDVVELCCTLSHHLRKQVLLSWNDYLF